MAPKKPAPIEEAPVRRTSARLKATAAPEPKPAKKQPAAKKAKIEEEQPPVKKLTVAAQKKLDAAAKKAKEEEEEEKPVAKPAKKITAAAQKKFDATAKKAKEEEEEEEKPVAKPAKKLTAAAQKKFDAAAKKAKEEEEEEEKPVAKPAKKITAAAKKAKEEEPETAKPAKTTTLVAAPVAKGQIPIDVHYDGPGTAVYLDYDAMLNQTNLGLNNNKFYKLQIICNGPAYDVFTRWGRVGEPGAKQTKTCYSPALAISQFCAKFKDKTKNDWEDRANFVKHLNKYQLLEMDYTQDANKLNAAFEDEHETDQPLVKIADSKLDKHTQWFVKLIFNKEMFNESMAHLKVDTSRLPLGALSQQQLQEGNAILGEIMSELDTGKPRARTLQDLSSKYYTVIPTAVGRSVPPTLNTAEMVQEKFDLLAVLADIEKATEMRKQTEKKDLAVRQEVQLKPNPVDALYETLDASLELLDAASEEFKRILTYAQNTGNASSYSRRELKHVWRITRSTDVDEDFHNALTNRKLLWHGTNAAVVAAILKSGLRIMPHSGGRVGRGIYLASEQSKSAGYVWAATSEGRQVGLMFLAEAALGKEHHITKDNPSLRMPPTGYDCVVAQGQQDPDPSLDCQVEICGRKVTVPQGKPQARSNYQNSSFWQSEFLLYNESQHKLRYVLAFDW